MKCFGGHDKPAGNTGFAAIAADESVLNISNSIKLYIFIQADAQVCRSGSKPLTLCATFDSFAVFTVSRWLYLDGAARCTLTTKFLYF